MSGQLLNCRARLARHLAGLAARWPSTIFGRYLHHGRHRAKAWRLSLSEWESVRVAAGGW